MITIKSQREIELMRIAGRIVGDTHHYLEQYIKPGVTTKHLDKLAYDYILSRNATPSFKGYEGYPATICTSINDEVVHGIPSNRKLREGDIISIDIGACYKGYHGDSAWTYAVSNISDENKKLLQHTEEALFAGLSVIKNGAKVGDIGYAVSKVANKYNLGVVKELVGHGVGTSVHEAPDVPNYGKEHTGHTLKEGMVIAVEPMLNLGTADIYLLDDDWTVITADGKPSAHFEHTVLVTKDGYEILTKR
ncbi:MAG: type I methionyl aminopeptidase [Clostridium sp.]|nr:type I methionyl aminopeptidase [Clostridium sp.]MCM1443825.1 type I methionyl aminopeptidase [Candidatus Amulumruptor caecigallinarius]